MEIFFHFLTHLTFLSKIPLSQLAITQATLTDRSFIMPKQTSSITPQDIIKAANGAPILSVDKCVHICGGLIAKKTFYNLICKGETPKPVQFGGRRKGFNTVEFAEWFCDRIKQEA